MPMGTRRAPRGSRRPAPPLGRALAHEIAVFLGEAAADGDLHVGSPLLELLEPAEMPVELVVGVLTDAAGVQHDDVGRVEVVGRFHALCDQQSGDPFRIVLVHLTAVGTDEEPTGHG